MLWLEAGVGVEVAVGGGSVALPLIHPLHLEGAPQKHPHSPPNPSCYHFHMTFPKVAAPPPGNVSQKIGIAGQIHHQGSGKNVFLRK